jgi:hypothetical protein
VLLSIRCLCDEHDGGKDSRAWYAVVVPALLMAMLFHPHPRETGLGALIEEGLWAFSRCGCALALAHARPA